MLVDAFWNAIAVGDARVRAVIDSGVSSAPDDVAAGAWVSRVCCGRAMCDGYAQAACVCVYVRVCMCVCVAADPVRGTQFERVRRLIGDVVVYCWSGCGCGEVACASAILRSVGRNGLAAGGCAAAFRARGMRHSGKLPGCCRFWLSAVTVQGGRGTFGGAPLSTRFTVTLKGAIRIPQVRNTCRCFSGRLILICLTGDCDCHRAGMPFACSGYGCRECNVRRRARLAAHALSRAILCAPTSCSEDEDVYVQAANLVRNILAASLQRDTVRARWW